MAAASASPISISISQSSQGLARRPQRSMTSAAAARHPYLRGLVLGVSRSRRRLAGRMSNAILDPTMLSLFELDQLTVRCRKDSHLTRAKEYDLLDSAGAVLGSATQDTGSWGSAMRRRIASSRARMPADFDVRDGSGALLAHVATRRMGVLRRYLRAEVSLADERVVAIASSSPGLLVRLRFGVSDGSGRAVAQVGRAGRTFLAITGTHQELYGAVDLEANTRSARKAGTAHPNSYVIRFEPAAPPVVRIATLGVVFVVDSLRGS